jgi:hypothetical protein
MDVDKGSSLSTLDEQPKKAKADPVEINILPVNPEEFSCKGIPNGNQVDPNPSDCLSFYACVEEVAYKIMCPKLPAPTFYDPIQRSCGFVNEKLCLEFAGQLAEKDSAEDSPEVLPTTTTSSANNTKDEPLDDEDRKKVRQNDRENNPKKDASGRMEL